MKAILNAKILTGVVILFFSCLSLGAEPNQGQCNQKCEIESRSSCTKPPGGADNDAVVKYNQCVRDAKQSCIELNGCVGLESAKDLKQSCKEAFDKYQETATKEKEACSAFDKEGGRTCKDKALACEKKITSLGDPTLSSGGEEPDDPESGYGVISEAVKVYSQVQSSKSQNQNLSIAAMGGACVKSIDRKARKDEKKDKDKERKELSDKIKTLKDDILKNTEDLNKERSELTEKINEVEAEAKKEALSKEKAITEETARVAKDLVDVAKKVRQRNLNITKEMQILAQVNFEFQKSMLALSDEKINLECKQQFEALKAALVSGGGIPGASAEDSGKFAAMSAQFKKNGIRGSGEMKRMLITTRKVCYENKNAEKSKAKLNNSQAVKNQQDKIEEEKNGMKDDKDAAVKAQKALEDMKAQTDKEKSAAETEKANKLDNLSKKLAETIENTDAKSRVASEKIQELTAEINNLLLVQNFEVEDAYSEASEAIEKGQTSRASAIEACDCENKTNTICNTLGKDQKSYDGKKINSKTKATK